MDENNEDHYEAVDSHSHPLQQRQQLKSLKQSNNNSERVVLAPIDLKALTSNQTIHHANNNLKHNAFAQVSAQHTIKPVLRDAFKTQQYATNRNKNNASYKQPQVSKPSGFKIFCDDENENENDESLSNVENHSHNDDGDLCEEENVENIKDKTQIDVDLDDSIMNSDQLISCLAINESIANVTCNESLMESEADPTESTSQLESDIDASLSFDSQLLFKCLEYTDEIHSYLLECERKNMPDPYFMAKQPEINVKMRSILIDWMVEVSQEYKLLDETLFLAVNCIDRFLSLMSVSRHSFQLLGTTAVFISSKYEEIYPPDINEFVYITDDSYSKEQILNMEKLILKVLQFDISSPTTHYFLEKFVAELSFSECVKHMAEYLCYLTLLECDPFLQFYPSEIAICCLITAAHTLGYEHEITDEFLESTLAYETKQELPDIKHLMSNRQACLEAIHKMHNVADKHPQQSIQQKYSTDRYFNVSMIQSLKSAPKL